MSTHNIRFRWEIRKISTLFRWKKASYLLLWYDMCLTDVHISMCIRIVRRPPQLRYTFDWLSGDCQFNPVIPSCNILSWRLRGWSGGAKVLCILHHRGVQLILAYSWARPAILVVGKGRGGMFLFLLFLHFHSCSSFFPVPLFHLLYSLFYLFSPFLWETTQNDPQGLTCR